jgi:hypothetical protein
MTPYVLLHRRTAAPVGHFATVSEAMSAYERIRAEDPQLAGELILLTPDEAEVVAHTALEFGQ